jgi:uncharacterized protein (DUF1778 family)
MGVAMAVAIHNQRYQVTLSKDEYSLFRKLAWSEGRSFSAWVRLACLDRAGLVLYGDKITMLDRDKLKKILEKV